ncbi:PTS transporter subunit EIIC, partial [Staphylococcus epidermidis]|uniref:PTS transporter subunit EIIC n=1 Tax=Staphylococcus epidermidis TaxID=1282 RepID=UPI0037DA6FB5
DGWIGVTVILGGFAFFWSVGIDGGCIVEAAIGGISYGKVERNLELIQGGEDGDKVIRAGTEMFVGSMGGTGGRLVVGFMFMWLR